ncbi:hypothetical protein ACS126_04915 [Sphingobacterium lactis]|uniref:HU domain-containing protein n=1 Tax=Sphingobacterium lactis TaxID=797291 RepID=UPI003EC59858
MDLGRYIHQLLKRRNEVYVKGLGVFKRIHTPSVYDEKRAVYLPPVTYLEFDAKSTSGVDFVDYLQQAKQLSKQAAEAEVEEAVVTLLANIRDNGQVQLNHIGQLIKHGSSLVFKAEDLSGFQLQPIERTIAEREEEPLVVEETVEPVPAPAPEVEEVVETPIAEEVVEAPVNEPVYEEEYSRPAGKSSWYIWVGLLALLIIGALVYFNWSSSAAPEATTAAGSDSTSGTTDSIAQASTLDSSKAVLADSLAADTTGKKVYNPLIPANHTYQIVIGTHSTLAQAYEQAESFNKAGVESVRVIPSNLAHNKKKVIWDSYETKLQADSALKYVRKHYVSDAWHQKIK